MTAARVAQAATTSTDLGLGVPVRGPSGWAEAVAAAGHVEEVPTAIGDLPFGIHYGLVPSLAQARQLLGPASDLARAERGRDYFAPDQYRLRSRLRLGMHDRGEAYVFADAPLAEEDLAGHARHLPGHLTTIRFRQLELEPGQVLDVTTPPGAWPGLDPREELYVLLVVDRLTAAPGCALRVRGNVAVLDIGELEADGDFTILVRGTDHAPFSAVRTRAALHGRDGDDGVRGADGRAARVAAGAFGPVVLEAGAPHGQDGADGDGGEPGTAGENGGMAMLADIRIGELVSSPPAVLHIDGKGGPGHPGGAGGAGGAGGDGGDGIESHPGTGEPPGRQGLGGAGGGGGRGGAGGNGGLSSHIFVTLPGRQHHSVRLTSRPSTGGTGGGGGPGGAGGRHGRGVRGQHTDGDDAEAGPRGQDGRPGCDRDGPPMTLLSSDPV